MRHASNHSHAYTQDINWHAALTEAMISERHAAQSADGPGGTSVGNRAVQQAEDIDEGGWLPK